MKICQSPALSKNSDFLKKFQGKSNAIGKKGLLELFKIPVHQPVSRAKINNQQLIKDIEEEEFQKRKQYYRQRRNQSVKVNRQSKLEKKTNHSNRTSLLKKEQSKDLNQFLERKQGNRLPIIKSKSTKSNIRISNLQKIDGISKIKKISPSKKMSFRDEYKSQLKIDKYALKYLDFLDLFEEKLKKLENRKSQIKSNT